ncbi:MAG: AprI/Inh family metalloprotease inhibitor [Beijerinckiaceae bacterium]
MAFISGMQYRTRGRKVARIDSRFSMLRPSPAVAAALCGLMLSACAGSGRFDGLPGYGRGSAPSSASPQPEAAPMAVPGTGAVISEPLPPPSYPGGAAPADPTQVAGQSQLPPTTPGATPLPGGQPPVASLPTPPAPPSQPVIGSSMAAVGSWTARDATGASCRVTLSSASALDLNKASASGCANRELQRVNAWKQQGGEIYLYSAGAVVARVPASGGSGALSRSGAPITMTR